MLCSAVLKDHAKQQHMKHEIWDIRETTASFIQHCQYVIDSDINTHLDK